MRNLGKKKKVKLTEAESSIVTDEGAPPSPARRNSVGKDSGTAFLGSSLQPRGARGKRSPCSLAPQQVKPGWEGGRLRPRLRARGSGSARLSGAGSSRALSGLAFSQAPKGGRWVFDLFAWGSRIWPS